MHIKLDENPNFPNSATEAIIALSTRKSDYYSAVRGTCRSLGMKAIPKSLAFEMAAEMETDSSASKGSHPVPDSGYSKL